MNKPVVLITGGSGTIGRAMALEFGRSGYAVALHYYSSPDKARLAFDQLTSIGAPVQLFKADIRNSAAVRKMVNAAVRKWGRLDVLVNNAGINRDNLLINLSDKEWRDVFSVNIDGAFYATRAALPIMRKKRDGVILNIASYVGDRGVRGAANYAASKAALVALTKCTAIEEGIYHIRANALLPGFHVTDMNRDYFKRHEAAIRAPHLLGELSSVDEFAKFIVHVAGLKTVTGQVLAFESRIR